MLFNDLVTTSQRVTETRSRTAKTEASLTIDEVDATFARIAGERFAALAEATPGLTVPRLVTGDTEAADAFFAETLAWQTKKFQDLALGTDGWTVHLRPELVVEIAFSDVQESPQYPAGMALRFARVKRYREDKPASEADTIETVRKIFAGGRT